MILRSTPAVEITEATNQADFARCIQIRTQVFVIGQNIPPEEEVDNYESDCRHYLARLDDVPVGTVRWRLYKDDTAKIERMAMLAAARGQGIAGRMLTRILEDIEADTSVDRVLLSAQDAAITLYQRAGFEVVGDGYLDVGIPHHDMVKVLDARVMPSRVAGASY